MTTDKISLDKSTYFKIILGLRLKASWYMYALPFVVAALAYIFMDLSEDLFLVKFLVVFGFVYPIWQMIFLYLHTQSNRAENIYLPRHYVINENEVQMIAEDGSEITFDLSEVIRVAELQNILVVYFSKGSFLPFPASAFDESDFQRFKELLSAHVKGR